MFVLLLFLLLLLFDVNFKVLQLSFPQMCSIVLLL